MRPSSTPTTGNAHKRTVTITEVSHRASNRPSSKQARRAAARLTYDALRSPLAQVDPYMLRDQTQLVARLSDVRRHEWGNAKGRGTVVKMEVTDASGDIQISSFDGADELFVTVYYLADGTTWQAIRADTGLLASTTLPPSVFTPTEYAITEAKDMWKAQKRRNEAVADHLRKELLDLEEDHRARQALKRSRRTK